MNGGMQRVTEPIRKIVRFVCSRRGGDGHVARLRRVVNAVTDALP